MIYTHRKVRGFTIVEMSIVLIIIGLILGGILKSTDVIKNARAKDLIQAVQDAQAAALSFKSKYGYLPGDLPNGGTAIPGIGACNGNGNGRLNTAGKRNCARDELIGSGMLRGQVGSPILVEGATITFSNAAGAGFALPANWQNVVVISNLNCETAYQIDQALDDGNTATGNFRTSAACPGANPNTPVPTAAFRIN